MKSVWEAGLSPHRARASLKGHTEVDVAIIGGGMTGISTAYHLAKKSPDTRIALFEAKTLGAGASGRNGGLVLTGIPGAHHAKAERLKRFYAVTKGAIDGIEQIIREHRLDVDFRRRGCLRVYTREQGARDALAYVEKNRGVGIELPFMPKEELGRTLRMRGIIAAYLDPAEGRLNCLAYVRELARYLDHRNVQIYENTPVLKIDEGQRIEITTKEGSVLAKAVVLGTNAYTPDLGYFRNTILPVHSYVVATEPCSEELQAESRWGTASGFSDDRSRLAYGCLTDTARLLLGGGSNASYDYSFGSKSELDRPRPSAYEAVRSLLQQYFPEAGALNIDHEWVGAIGMTLPRSCTMGALSKHNNVFYALGYSGCGITMAALAGDVLSDLYVKKPEKWRDLPFLNYRPPPFPPEPFRWLGYQFFTKLTGRTPRKQRDDV